MYCYNCGYIVPDEARFCSQCGCALTPRSAQPQTNYAAPQAQAPSYTQVPSYTQAPSYAPAPVKGGVNIVYPDGHNEIGDIYISAAEIRFVRKSKAVRVAFGMIGSAIENGQEALCFNVSDIIDGRKTRIGLNPNVYQITLRNGDIYKLCLNQPKNIAVLDQIIRNR